MNHILTIHSVSMFLTVERQQKHSITRQSLMYWGREILSSSLHHFTCSSQQYSKAVLRILQQIMETLKSFTSRPDDITSQESIIGQHPAWMIQNLYAVSVRKEIPSCW